MKKRIEQIQRILRDNSLAAAILRLPENVLLCSLYYPRNSFAFVFIPADGEATLIAPEGDQDDPDRGTMEDVRRFGWVKLSDGNPFENVGAILGDLRKAHRLTGGCRIGLDMNPDVISPSLCFGEMMPMGSTSMAMISGVFDTTKLVDVSADIRALHTIKQDEEIERIELANQIGMQAIDTFVEIASTPGVREIDIAAHVERFVAVTTPGYAGRTRFGRAIAQVTSGPENTASAWFAGMISTDRVVQKGDFVMIEMGISVDGFWSDLTRTVVVGSPTERQMAMMTAVDEAQSAAIERMRVGVRAAEVDAAARETIGNAGLGDAFVHALGHGVGFSYHDGDPVFVPDSPTELAPGMIYSCEPGVYIADVGGVRQEVNVLMGAEGPRVLGRKD